MSSVPFSSPRRRLVAAIVLFGAHPATYAAEAVAPYPQRPIKLLVGFTPGGGSDVVARSIGARIGAILGQPLVIENRPGAAGAIAMQAGARARPDGYTLALGTTSTLITSPALASVPLYDPQRDFVPVAPLARTAFVLVVASQAGAPASLAELIAALHAAPQAYASAGSGTIGQLASAMMLKRAGAEGQHVPYGGSAQALTDVAGGRALFMTDATAATLPLLQAGKLRALAVTSRERLAALPEVPTFSESTVSGFADFTLLAWWGLVAPAHTEPAIVQRLNRAATEALAGDDLRRELRALGLEPFTLPVEAFTEFVRRETLQWRAFLDAAR